MGDDASLKDPYRVVPAEHRGRDHGILDRAYVLARDRADADPAGPRALPRDRDGTDR